MDNELREKEYQKILKLKKQYTNTVYVGLVLSILFAVLSYLILEAPIKIYLSILGFFAINYIFIFVIAKQNENKFFKLYDELIVKKVLEENFQNVNIQKEIENKYKINVINIFNGKKITTSNYIECAYKDLPLEIIESKVEKYVPYFQDTYEGIGRKKYTEIFNGLVYCYKFNENNKNNINIVSKYYLQNSDNIKIVPYTDYKKKSIFDSSYKEVKYNSEIPLNKINLQNEQYKDWFAIYADCNINEKKMCDNILNLILELRKQVNKKIFIIIQEEMLYIGVNTYYSLYKTEILSLKKKLEDEVNNLTNHISLIKQIINKIQEEIEIIKESKEGIL